MLRRVNFVLLREGTSDEGLIPHLQELLVRHGVDEAIGSARNYTGNLLARISATLAEEVPIDLIFVHRDSDGSNPSPRYQEIERAARDVGTNSIECIAIVPIRELEAWLLLDEVEIRRVAGKPSGRSRLGLPSHKEVEHVNGPKEVLRRALIDASETTGRRRRSQERLFPQHRRILLQRLDTSGPVAQLSAWRRLESDIVTYTRAQGWLE